MYKAGGLYRFKGRLVWLQDPLQASKSIHSKRYPAEVRLNFHHFKVTELLKAQRQPAKPNKNLRLGANTDFLPKPENHKYATR